VAVGDYGQVGGSRYPADGRRSPEPGKGATDILCFRPSAGRGPEYRLATPQSRNADARILSFAIRLQHRAAGEGGAIVLLSNDNLLRLNARSEGIMSYSTREVKQNPRILLAKIAPNFIPPLGVQEAHPSVHLPPLGPTGQPVQKFSFPYAYSANQPTAATKALPKNYWAVPSSSGGTSAAPSPAGKSAAKLPAAASVQAAIIGPDAEFAKCKGLVMAPMKCQGCNAEPGKSIKVSKWTAF